MKKILTLVVAILLSATAFAQFSGSGSGTSNDPYLIFNPIQLDQVRNFVGTGNKDVYFKLMADIDLAEFIADNYPTQGWLPIGSYFCGYFDGNGKKISNLSINRPSTNLVGFFASCSGHISDLTIEVNIIGGNYTGGLAGRSDGNGTITNVCVKGFIEGGEGVGGIAGKMSENATITSCFIETSIKGTKSIGGIVGDASAFPTISSSSAFVTIQATGDYCGGIVGRFYSSKSTSKHPSITQCFASGDIISTKNSIGGIVGFLSAGSGTNTSTGYVTSYASPVVENNYFYGIVLGSKNVGAICGSSSRAQILSNYSSATLSGVEYVGGLVGNASSTTITQNVLINKSIVGNQNVGRICGYRESGSIGALGSNSVNKVLNTTKIYLNGIEQVFEDNAENGQGVGNSLLKYKATYQGIQWDFTDIWEQQETESYPYFKRQVAPPIINVATSGQTTVSGKGTNGKVIKISVDGQTYQTTCSNNTWSVTTSPLVAGSTICAIAGYGIAASYPVYTIVTYPGQGTEENPYEIYTAQELANINGSGNYKIMNDIDVSSINPWIPIGQNEIVTAHLNGDNHTISGLKINTTDNYQGLFAQCDGSKFKNITISVSQLKGGDYTGALVGKIVNGNIENCRINGNVTGGKYTGGIVGYCQNTLVLKCIANSNIVGTTNVGGLIGSTKYNGVKYSKSTGSVSSTTASAIIGGLVGVNDATLTECCSTGSVTCNGSSSIVGGLIGQNGNRVISNSYSSGAVTGTKYAGGLIGYNNQGTVTKCYARGKITGTDVAAGLVGYNNGTTAVIEKSCVMNPTITASSSSGIVMRVVGGLLNSAPVPDMDNYALKTMVLSVNGVAQTIYDDNLNGTAKIDSVLKKESTYSGLGWNMDNVWGITEGTDYPFLRCFTQVATITFCNYDGSVLQSGSVIYGTLPVYSGTTPAKPADTQYSYTFAGWTPEIVAVNGDATYTATYNSTLRKYIITFKDDEGNTLCEGEWEYGSMPSCEEPTKEADNNYTYTFAGWTPEIEAVKGSATYVATFEAEPIIHEGIPVIDVEPQAIKIIRDNQFLILRGDRTYTLTGQEVK